MTKTPADNQIAFAAPRGVPRRAFLGAGLVGLVAAAAGGLGFAGFSRRPQSTDFRFSRGTSFAPGEDARLNAHLASIAADPRLSVQIIGHSGTEGDGAANIAVSQDRADLVAGMAQSLGLTPDRVTAVTGVGGAAPLARPDGMGSREYERSLARVTITAHYLP